MGVLKGLETSGERTTWLIVILAVASAVFSGVAFWESSRLGNDSDDLVTRTRYAQVEEDQRRSTLQAGIAHDLRVSQRCRTAEHLRDDALVHYSQSFEERDLAELVDAELERVTLESLGTVPYEQVCAPFNESTLSRIFAVEETGQRLFEASDPATLRAASERLGDAEKLAVAATVVFALALLALALAEQAVRASLLRRCLAVAAVSLAAGFALIIGSTWVSKQIPVTAMLVAGTSGLVMAVLGALVISERPRVRQWRYRLGFGGRVILLAEVLGAVSVVALTLSAWGFTASSVGERDAIAEADALTSQARRALQLGQESTLASLDFMQELAELEPRAPEAVHEWAERASEMWNNEQGAWERLVEEQASDPAAPGTGRDCLNHITTEVVLPWRSHLSGRDAPGIDDQQGPVPFPRAVLIEFRDDPGIVSQLVSATASGSTVCSTQAAIVSQRGLGWGDRALDFAVAIVVLGLAGFLFALAASRDIPATPQHWVLSAAVVGLTAGSLLVLGAWLSAPPIVPDDRLEEGSLAFARSHTALMNGDCDLARREAEVAADALAHFPAAQTNKGYAAFCRADGDWLLTPDLPDHQRQIALEQFEHAAVELGEDGAMADLGWMYILQGLNRQADGEPSDAILQRGADLTREALIADPARPWVCFNWAFVALAAGDVALARERYAEVVSALRGVPLPDGECRLSRMHSSDQDRFKLLALSDLELLPEELPLDDFREMIVSGGDDGTAAGNDLGSELWSLDVFPQEIQLSAEDEDTDEFAAIWYHRSGEDEPWSLMARPSFTTLVPGYHTGPQEVEAVLPDGEYRVDLYFGGRIAERVEVTGDRWASRDLVSSDFRRVEFADLGVSAVVPDDWEVASSEWGRSVEYAGKRGQAEFPGRVEFRRQDGASLQDMRAQVVEWSGRSIEEFLDEDKWYLGIVDYLVAHPHQGLYVGAGNEQYLITENPDFFPVDHETCPGRTLMTQVVAEEPAVADTIWWSQGTAVTPFTVTAEEIGLAGSYDGPALSVQIPEGWTAAACPGSFAARAPDGEANFLVSHEDSSQPLSDHLAEALRTYEADADFRDFNLLDRRAVTLSNGVPGEQITFSWTAEGSRVQQTQLYAVAGGRVYYLTFTTTEEQFDAFQKEREQVLTSFEPR